MTGSAMGGVNYVELAPGIDIIQTSFRQRPLNLPIIRGRKVVLIDSGLASTPAQAIVPFLGAHALTPSGLDRVIITHAHADHYGGNHELWLASGRRVRFATHGLDQAWIEDPPGHTRRAQEPYVKLGLMTDAQLEQEVEESGAGVKVDDVLQGGEVFSLGDGLELEIWHLPGHTMGNIAVLERQHGLLLQGETIIGVAQYDTGGRLLSCPNHEDTVSYVRTIAAVARLDFTTLVPSHLAPMDRQQAAQFLAESLSFVLRFEEEVTQRLRTAGRAVSAVELWRSLGRLWDVYPNDLALYALLESHLRSLIRRGLVEGVMDTGVRWRGGDDELGSLAADARLAIEAM